MKNNTRKIIVFSGPSGVGKSYTAKELVASSKDKIRISRDDLRAAFYGEKNNFTYEKFTISAQRAAAATAIREGFIPIIDDTNLKVKNIEDWTKFAEENSAEIEVRKFTDTIENCIARDALRTGKSHVGAAVIYRQFVEGKLFSFPDPNKKIVIVDVDGTVADSTGVRSPYDEHMVLHDKPYPIVVEWVKELAKDYYIVIASGRHSTCGDDTILWLKHNEIPFELVLMREGWTSDKDVQAKQRILDALLGIIPKERIAFVLDDRQQVIFGCWKKNGLTVYPVRGLGEDTNF